MWGALGWTYTDRISGQAYLNNNLGSDIIQKVEVESLTKGSITP